MIIGAGLAGLSAALHMPSEPVLLVEREDHVGGKAATHHRDGFTFDVTGHWLHVRNPAVRQLVHEVLQPDDLREGLCQARLASPTPTRAPTARPT